MSRHLITAATRGAANYFCDSHPPWQRGTNETTNGLLRDFLPGVTLINHARANLPNLEQVKSRPQYRTIRT